MKHILELLRKKVPRSGKAMPAYYRSALATTQIVLVIYFLLVTVMLSRLNHRLEWVPALMGMGMLGCHYSIGRVNCRLNVYAFDLLILIWCAWHTYFVGWRYGAQHLLIPMLMLCFFNIYEPPALKLVTFLLVVFYRMALFSYSLTHDGVYTIDGKTMIVLLQLLNSLTLFDILAVDFITFSSSIQENERELILHNQALHKEAGTDPLTQLPNRRALLDVVHAFVAAHPDEPYSVAIADIDFFKKVNDTYGLHCGDYTLKELSVLFMAHAGKYTACRWGGEEFCFFMPGLNLDEAGVLMNDLCFAVEKMKLKYEEHEFTITITIGVEEFDFASPLDELMDAADEKLYMGKNAGRNRVIL